MDLTASEMSYMEEQYAGMAALCLALIDRAGGTFALPMADFMKYRDRLDDLCVSRSEAPFDIIKATIEPAKIKRSKNA